MRVLIVEDEADLAVAVRLGLVAEGYTVDVCADGIVGYEMARAGDYDIILLDLMIPGLNGYRVIERLRGDGVQTPILVLTAKLGTYDQTEALDTGADDYVTKPFTFSVLLARVRALLRRAGVQQGAYVLTVGKLRIERLERTASYSGQVLDLTPLEFSLLEMLAGREGEPVSKDEMLAVLWPDDVRDPNLVEARVAALRRKIDAPVAGHMLQTVRGVGYRLVDDRGATVGRRA